MSYTADEWAEILQREYLQGFIKQGGAAVKFCIHPNEQNSKYTQKIISEIAHTEGYVFASVDAAYTKIHHIDEVFYKIAKQIDWDLLAKTYLRNFYIKQGYRLPPDEGDFSIQSIARINNFEEMQFRNDTRSGIQRALFGDYDMSQEFRFAMSRLCINQFDTNGPEDYLSSWVIAWLQGKIRLISSLKDALIFQRITKYNARYILYSLAHWIKLNGMNGLVLVIDLTGCYAPKKYSTDTIFVNYSTSMVLDTYEVLRQFIDGTSDMDSLLMIIQAPIELIVDEKRGLERYDALKMRIWNEVRDLNRQNPLSSLVRLSS